MKARVLCVCALLLLTMGAARGQQPDQDPIGQSFFAPEFVIQHQEAIGLSAEQKEYLKSEIRQAQLKFTEYQWKLQDEMEKLVALVKQPRVDEQQVLAQLEKLLAAEREVKREQVTLLVRIKNKLTAEQQAKLLELRTKPANK
ncbi:MAG TPA: periplasmic heavy metal sensor [Candidatus Acidoferrum sp.]|jgi:Spy/CpxP family protein refolding chaperone|nr:periplasmic heavy metal sensor [Candidatus Acidoferrum sp.]